MGKARGLRSRLASFTTNAASGTEESGQSDTQIGTSAERRCWTHACNDWQLPGQAGPVRTWAELPVMEIKHQGDARVFVQPHQVCDGVAARPVIILHCQPSLRSTAPCSAPATSPASKHRASADVELYLEVGAQIFEVCSKALHRALLVACRPHTTVLRRSLHRETSPTACAL